MAKITYVTIFYKTIAISNTGFIEEIYDKIELEETNFKIADIVKDGGFWLDVDESIWIPYSAIKKIILDEVGED